MSAQPRYTTPQRSPLRCDPSRRSGLRARPIHCRRCASGPWSASCSLGLPTTRDESWRYTNLRPLAAQSFVDAPRAPAGRSAAHDVAAPSGRAGARAATVLMVNGYPVLPASMDLSINGIEISSLARFISNDNPSLLSRHLQPLSDAEEARWRLLNTALFVDGLYLKINTRVAAPLVILHVATAEGPDTRRLSASHHRSRRPDRAPRSSNTTSSRARRRRCAIPPRASRSNGMRRSSTIACLQPARKPRTSIPWTSARNATAAAGSSPSRSAAAWCAHRSTRSLSEPGRPPRQLLAAGRPRGAPRRLRERRHARRAGHPQPANGARDRERHQPRDLQQQGRGRGRRRARGFAAVLPRLAAVARPPKSIRGRSWKFTPTRSSAPMARPPAGSTPTCSSTCCRAAWTARPPRACWCMRSSPMC